MITEDYVSFETAKLLKEKGFDAEGVSEFGGFYVDWYHTGQHIGIATESEMLNKTLEDWEYLRPTLQMAMKWLREVYELYIEISLSCDREDKNAKIFDASIFNIQNQRYKKLSNIQGYEEACEAAIKYCLENLI